MNRVPLPLPLPVDVCISGGSVFKIQPEMVSNEPVYAPTRIRNYIQLGPPSDDERSTVHHWLLKLSTGQWVHVKRHESQERYEGELLGRDQAAHWLAQRGLEVPAELTSSPSAKPLPAKRPTEEIVAGREGGNARPPQGTIWFLGNRQYQIGERVVPVTTKEDNVLQSFLGNQAQDEPLLKETSGEDDPARILRDLCKKKDGIFSTVIQLAGKKGADGYRIKVEKPPDR